MTPFSLSEWIWCAPTAEADAYGEFFTRFTADGKSPTVCRLSCDGDYTLFVNGMYAASNQYGDYEHYKIYDEIPITPHLTEGENTLAILVWHHGTDTQRYRRGKAGLLFEVESAGTVLAQSGARTLARPGRAYRSGYKKEITGQLGYSFFYDAAREDGWLTTGEGMSAAVPVAKRATLYPRPTGKLSLGEPLTPTLLKAENGTHFLLDLGEETVGLFTLAFTSPCEQTVTVAYGEHILDGDVRRFVGGRDFSVEYGAKAGENRYTNYMLRLGCRYLSLTCSHPITLSRCTLIPQFYPVKERNVNLPDPMDAAIWRLSVRTLKLSMMEHYVDTPWREQCLYAFDARNQMLCGYYAFEEGNQAYARANLKLMSEDRREDGLLSICYPCGTDLTIPSFSLYYFMALREYTEHTKDLTLAREVYPKLLFILDAFLHNRKNGLVHKFDGANRWNFYDWSDALDGSLGISEATEPDLVLNCLFLLALDSLRRIADVIGEPFRYAAVIEEEKSRVREAFFRPHKGLFSHDAGETYTALGNALAILSGVCEGEEAKVIADRLTKGEMSPCSLSMKTFVYDACLQADEAKHRAFVLSSLRADYGRMLSAGATATWETIDGAEAFDGAGSLCHGWSAIPVYYYHRLLLS